MAIPVSLADARRQLRMEADDETRDDDLNAWIADAAAWVENYTGHILDARDVEQRFAGRALADLGCWPIKPDAVATISYTGADGQPATLIGRLDTFRRPARVSPLAGTSWPFTSCDQRFTVTVRAGYEAVDIVPGNMKRAMLMLITAYDEDREGGEIFKAAEKSARSLCQDFRLKRL